MIVDPDDAIRCVKDALEHAYATHGRLPWGRHEFYGILKEEVDELWDAIKSDAAHCEVHEEIYQVMAVCLRFLETGDRYGDRYDGAKYPHHCKEFDQ